MGAATALFYVNRSRDRSIRLLILDSPYDDIEEISKIMCQSRVHIPNFVVDLGLAFIKSTLSSKANLDLSQLKPIKFVEQLDIPAMFITGELDKIVPMQNTMAHQNK